MLLNSNCRLLFIGDSITDCGRARPIGQGSTDTLGNGYVSLVDAMLAATYPDLDVHVMNTGVSGDTVRDLETRWDRDVLALNPDWLSVMIGINDVWRQFDGLWELGNRISLQEYSDTLSRLIEPIRPNLKGLVLMSPYYLEPDRRDPMRHLMDEFTAAMAETAKQHDAVFVDTQQTFDGMMRYISPQRLADDLVHVGLTGHMALARAFLKGIAYDF